MVSGPSSEFSNLISPQFFEKATERLQIPPEPYQQFQKISQNRLDSFETEVKEQMNDLIAQLKADKNLDAHTMTKSINQTQLAINRRIDEVLDEIHASIKNTVGKEHEKFITPFIEDLRKHLVQQINVEEIVQKDPSLRQKAHFSIFELSASEKNPGGSRVERAIFLASNPEWKAWFLEDVIKSVKQWEQKFSSLPESPQARLANDLAQAIPGIAHAHPEYNNKQLLEAVSAYLLKSHLGDNKQSLFMKHYPLKESELTNLVKNHLGDWTSPIPKPNNIDEKYFAAHSLLQAASSSKDQAFAQSMVEGIGNMGSFGNKNTFKSWMHDFISNPQSSFSGASNEILKQFAKITGEFSPLLHCVDGVRKWEEAFHFKTEDGQTRFANDFIQSLKNIAPRRPWYGSEQLGETALLTIYPTARNDKQNVYMKYYPLQEGQVRAFMENIYPGGVRIHIISPTAMDKKYASAQKLFESSGSSEDRALAQTLIGEIANMGSHGSEDALKSWAQNLIANRDSSFGKASSEAQAEFIKITVGIRTRQ